jgi:hypothetical protein
MAENCAAKVEISRCFDRDIHMAKLSRELTPDYRPQPGDEVSLHINGRKDYSVHVRLSRHSIIRTHWPHLAQVLGRAPNHS